MGIVVFGDHGLANLTIEYKYYRSADKSLARPGRNQAAPVKSVMDRGMDWFGYGRDR